jgi:hypothetical protein
VLRAGRRHRYQLVPRRRSRRRHLAQTSGRGHVPDERADEAMYRTNERTRPCTGRNPMPTRVFAA